jgi:predicted enzyme related to lactoylglutathione lyase
MMPKVKKIAYFVYFADDMERAMQFYQDTLGLEVEYATPAWVEFKAEGGTFALHKRDEAHKDVKNPGGGGIVGFVVEDIQRVADELRAKNVTVHGDIREEHFGKLLNIEDLDGNIINLFEPARVAHPH